MYDRLERDRLVTRLVLGAVVVFLIALIFIPGEQPDWLPMGFVGLALLALNGLRYRFGLRVSVISIVLGLLALALSLYWLTGNSFVLFHKAIPPAPVLIGLGLLVVIYGETFFEGRIA
jgi:NADH:ubiquinone oxidoreductase subunit K